MCSGEDKLYATWVKAKELEISLTECLLQFVVTINSDDCPEVICRIEFKIDCHVFSWS
jgi:hypothetical protein